MVTLIFICYAALFALVVALQLGPIALRAIRRKRHGNCVRCGYPCGGLAGCPECGPSGERWLKAAAVTSLFRASWIAGAVVACGVIGVWKYPKACAARLPSFVLSEIALTQDPREESRRHDVSEAALSELVRRARNIEGSTPLLTRLLDRRIAELAEGHELLRVRKCAVRGSHVPARIEPELLFIADEPLEVRFETPDGVVLFTQWVMTMDKSNTRMFICGTGRDHSWMDPTFDIPAGCVSHNGEVTLRATAIRTESGSVAFTRPLSMHVELKESIDQVLGAAGDATIAPEITFGGITRTADGDFRGTLALPSSTLNKVACGVRIRVLDGEQTLGETRCWNSEPCYPGRSYGLYELSIKGKGPSTCRQVTVVLTSDADMACKNMDATSWWQGEVRQNIQVTDTQW